MPEPAGPDLVITNVIVPLFVGCGTFNIDVQVTSGQEDFEDGVAYRLFVVVTSRFNPNVLITRTGNLQTPPWSTFPTSTITVPVNVVPSPSGFDIYDVTAVLVEGPKGVPDAGDPPSVVRAGPIIVFC